MKSKSTLSILSLAILFASCTTAYKSGQTPDDVYYSPARPQEEYVRVDKEERRDDRMYRYNEEEYRDDRYLRMKIRDRRYSGLYDDYYSYNPYYYHYYNGRLLYNTPWSGYSYWNYYYNPYCAPVISVIPKSPVYNNNRPRTFDLSVYTPQPSNNNVKGIRSSSSNTNNSYRPSYNTSSNNSTNSQSSGRDAGSFLRDVFSGSSNNSSRSSSSGTYNTNSSSSSSSSSSNNSSGSSSGSSGSRGNASRGN